jgi:hypothetical protein
LTGCSKKKSPPTTPEINGGGVLWPHKVPVVVLSGHQPSWPSPGRSVAGAAYAGLLFPTLVYAEKVRAQFLSLRQPDLGRRTSRAKRAQNPADFADGFVRENLAGGFPSWPTYGAIVEAIDFPMQTAATAAEMKRRGGGLAYIIFELTVRGVLRSTAETPEISLRPEGP